MAANLCNTIKLTQILVPKEFHLSFTISKDFPHVQIIYWENPLICLIKLCTYYLFISYDQLVLLGYIGILICRLFWLSTTYARTPHWHPLCTSCPCCRRVAPKSFQWNQSLASLVSPPVRSQEHSYRSTHVISYQSRCPPAAASTSQCRRWALPICSIGRIRKDEENVKIRLPA